MMSDKCDLFYSLVFHLLILFLILLGLAKFGLNPSVPLTNKVLK